jgi:ABC-2 type transport system permease protein
VKTNIAPIYFRELKSLFYSPVAWLVLFAYFMLAGIFWAMTVSNYASMSMYASMRPGTEMKIVDYMLLPYFGNVTVTFIFLLPLVSMRFFSEEKKSGTIELLFTYPLSDSDIVLGKWFATLTLLAAMLLPTLLWFAVIAGKTSLPWAIVLCGLTSNFLMGACFLSVGLLTSSLTENQVIAAALSFGSILFLFVIGWMDSLVSGLIKTLLEQISVTSHFQDLIKGVINLKDISYFVLFTALMLFGTLRVLESKSWR